MKLSNRFLILFSFTWAAFCGQATAQLDFMQWVNPGPLSKPHEALEGVSNCTKCHSNAKGVPDQKCLSCHTEIQEQSASKKGLHPRFTDTCIKCHSDHKGRNYDLNALSRFRFDHSDTGWPLVDAHSSVSCNKCHTQTRGANRTTYLKASPNCASCHQDVHKSKDPGFQKCERCHAIVDFHKPKARMAFDHNRETRYPLTGQHAGVKCYDCHKQKTWKPLPFARCQSCHADPHRGQFGATCTQCHTTSNWKTGNFKGVGTKASPFDHNKTKFPLTGAHKDATCARCHGPVIGKMRGFEQCSGCHNNPHGNQFKELWSVKKECTDCHLTDSWKILSFEHNKDSRYELVEKHKTVPCQQCHADQKYRWLPKTPDCDTCHKDVHSGQFNKACAACHTPKGFSQLIFDHNRDAAFPLVGKHQKVDCNKCHNEGRYKGLERRCQGCHNDFHNNQLGQECTRCHAPTGFQDVEFDHNRGSRFRLDGAHLKNQCNQCHWNYQYKFPERTCNSCHLDVHKGSFGASCERCHNTASFSTKTGFHDFGEFSLGGAHDRLDCLVCHGPKSPMRIQPPQCTACHKDPHMNSLGPSCYNCHTQNAWLPTTFRHNQTGFELSGAHRFVSCDRCHFNRVFGGLPQECVFCHSKDFKQPPGFAPHIGAPLECQNCHLTFGWRPVR